jgi:4-hydroxybenzoate polyprenyltransferase
VNDLLDLEADRAHPRKRRRPFAAGDLSIVAGVFMSLALIACAILISAFVPPAFLLALAVYYAATLAYSFALKGIVVIDVVTLASLYTARLVAGAVALDIQMSYWLLLFSLFLFFSLALLKRFAELEALRRERDISARGRGYTVADLPLLQSLGSASGYISVVVLALYINSPEIEVLYRRPMVIWLLCVLLLYWISRMWIKGQRGEMHDDPVVFAFRDRASLTVGTLAAVALFFSL